MTKTAIDHIEEAHHSSLVDDDGNTVSIESLPPPKSEEVKALEASVGQPLPEELRELLAFCSGMNGVLERIDFVGMDEEFGIEEIFPNSLAFAHDGFGNYWVLDLTPETTEVAPVFFACHDAPVILYQSPNLATFFEELFKMYTPPHKSLVDNVHEDKLFDVWGKNPGVIDHADAVHSSDSVIRSFAQELAENFVIIDLRNVEPGMGFSWGRFGARTEVRRYGYERIFAYAKTPRTGFWAKILGP